jgi:putative ABC transport system ATP-binding protein
VSTRDVLALLHELHDQGRTIVLITHEHNVATESQRQVQIYDGLLAEGLPV